MKALRDPRDSTVWTWIYAAAVVYGLVVILALTALSNLLSFGAGP
jgi:hypothetical protein